jgi:hypothetical protein
MIIASLEYITFRGFVYVHHYQQHLGIAPATRSPDPISPRSKKAQTKEQKSGPATFEKARFVPY